MTAMLRLEDVSKTFILHLMDGARLPVVSGVTFSAKAGCCHVLGGPSGAGKSSLLKMIYGNYRTDEGSIFVRDAGGIDNAASSAMQVADESDDKQWVDITRASPRRILALRARTIGYVSQFLRVIPRVSAFDIVANAGAGMVPDPNAAARQLLSHLAVPERLWRLPPATFSGGEQQRVNIARGFIANRPILLLDEPTASLDARNRDAVMELIQDKKSLGVAMLAIFHDPGLRDQLADEVIDVTAFAGAQAVPA